MGRRWGRCQGLLKVRCLPWNVWRTAKCEFLLICFYFRHFCISLFCSFFLFLPFSLLIPGKPPQTTADTCSTTCQPSMWMIARIAPYLSVQQTALFSSVTVKTVSNWFYVSSIFPSTHPPLPLSSRMACTGQPGWSLQKRVCISFHAFSVLVECTERYLRRSRIIVFPK